MSKIIITNNALVYEKYHNKYEVIFLENAQLLEVLYEARDKIHQGFVLLTHPMSGSIKPNQTPFKSIIITPGEERTDYESLTLIENSIAVTLKLLNYKKTPNWNEKALDDFRTIDLSLIENVIETSML
ncbi:MAG TPA: GrdX protein [Clostridiaceae bacterium]|nr:GrdX protein [Clostridiaceae bacterium]